MIFEEERGEKCNTLHLQGYFELKNANTWNALMKQFKFCYLARRRGTVDQCITYCSKEGKQVEFGKRPKQGQRTDLLIIQEKIKQNLPEVQIAEEHFSQWLQYGKRFEAYRELLRPARSWETEVIVYWGKAGCGKSRKAWDHFPDADDISIDGDRFVLGYKGSETVIWEEFDPDKCPRSLFLKLTDRYKCTIAIKGGEKNWNPKRIVITSNIDPKTWYCIDKEPEAVQRRLSNVLFFGTKKLAQKYSGGNIDPRV